MNLMAVEKWGGVGRQAICNKLFCNRVNTQQDLIIGNESKGLQVSGFVVFHHWNMVGDVCPARLARNLHFAQCDLENLNRQSTFTHFKWYVQQLTDSYSSALCCRTSALSLATHDWTNTVCQM